ncbi:hypothetical protein NDK43_26225 [Neobacillus pocheonensis]|uniref:Spore coat protein n=1 Tax=Neobacillus pocheonensis TaxID=363869 RepID=A0ABT0WFX8_9BACI|nr:hypothetical protein [Neobacillus pocheonensis]
MHYVHNYGFGNVQYSGYTGGTSPAPFHQVAFGSYPNYYFVLSGQKIRIFPHFPQSYGYSGGGIGVPFSG